MWLEKTEKLSTCSASAARMVSAVDGMVVSKPMPKNTTSREGFFLARPSASMGE